MLALVFVDFNKVFEAGFFSSYFRFHNDDKNSRGAI